MPLAATAIGESTVAAVGGDTLTIDCPAARVLLLNDPEQQRLVASACQALFGVRLRLVVRTAAGSRGAQGAVTDERQRRYQAAEEHPVVRDLKKLFDAELVGRELVDLGTWLARLAAERDAPPRRRYSGDLAAGDLGGQGGDRDAYDG